MSELDDPQYGTVGAQVTLWHALFGVLLVELDDACQVVNLGPRFDELAEELVCRFLMLVSYVCVESE
jgi:hypothetical protein